MRTAFVLIILLPFGLGFRRPDLTSTDDKRLISDIERKLDVGKILDDAVTKRKDELLKKVQREGESAATQSLREKIAGLEDRRNSVLTEAVHLTASLYDLNPPKRETHSVLPDNMGQQLVWAVAVGDLKPYSFVDNDGHVQTRLVPPNAAAVSDLSGAAMITPEACRGGRALIAAYILHEARHFEQYSTPGMGDAMSQPLREEDAYTQVVLAGDALGLTESQRDAFKAKAVQMRTAAPRNGDLDRSEPMDSRSDFTFNREELSDIRRRSSAVARNVEDARMNRISLQEPLESAIAEEYRDEQSGDAFEALAPWIESACTEARQRFLSEETMLGWQRWRDAWLPKVRANLNVVDYSDFLQHYECKEFLVNQILYHRRNPNKMEWDRVQWMIREAAGREQFSLPTIPPPTQSVGAPPGSLPDPVVPERPNRGDDRVRPDYNRCIESRCIRW